MPRCRGRPSNRRISGQLKQRVLGQYRKKYLGFGPTLANEKLFALDGIKISAETLRKWLIEEDLWRKRRRRGRHRCWRQRKGCFGQMDGSGHDWLEGRGPELVLMCYIDDATSTVFARFYDYEGTFPAVDSFRRYIECYGIPQSVYVDKHTIYKSPRKLTIEEELEGLEEPKTQFERALGELAVEVIHAHSPQAKGRVERLFGTFQDRLVKEMRLAGVRTREQANRFLQSYLPGYNRRFSVRPREKADLHREIPRGVDLDSIFSVRQRRVLRKDFTVAYNRGLYQIEDPPPGVRMKSVVVEHRLDGSIHILHGGRELKYKRIQARRSRPKKQRVLKPKKPYIPPPDHPWRRLSIVSSNKINEPVY